MVSIDDAKKAAAKLDFQIPIGHDGDYVTLLQKTDEACRAVLALDGLCSLRIPGTLLIVSRLQAETGPRTLAATRCTPAVKGGQPTQGMGMAVRHWRGRQQFVGREDGCTEGHRLCRGRTVVVRHRRIR
jgi:hypothetical protein